MSIRRRNRVGEKLRYFYGGTEKIVEKRRYFLQRNGKYLFLTLAPVRTDSPTVINRAPCENAFIIRRRLSIDCPRKSNYLALSLSLTCWSVSLPCLKIYIFLCLFIGIFFCLSVCLTISQSRSLPIYKYVALSFSISLSLCICSSFYNIIYIWLHIFVCSSLSLFLSHTLSNSLTFSHFPSLSHNI